MAGLLGRLLSKVASSQADDAARAIAGNAARTAVSSQGDDIARAAARSLSSKGDDALRIMADKLDDGVRGAANSIDDITRIGSKNVAPINPETLPAGWDKLDDFLNGPSPVERAVGKSKGKITKADLSSYLEDAGYDSLGTKDQLWKATNDAWYDNFVDDLYMDDAGRAADLINTRRMNPQLGDLQDVYLGANGRTGQLDAELSDRLGIGRSNTPKLDRVNGGSAQGDYAAGVIGTDPTWAVGEDGISTAGHERLHSFQYEGGQWNYDDRVRDAYNQLHEDLSPYLHDDATILARHGRNASYYGDPKEQEARMFQNYLDSKKFTNRRYSPTRSGEWGEEINPAFDKFLETLRGLSAEGVALPAIGILGGTGILGGLLGDGGENNRGVS